MRKTFHDRRPETRGQFAAMLALVSLLVLGGCSSSEQRATVRSMTSVLPAPRASFELTELLFIDDEANGPLIGVVGDQALGANGQIYVSDYQANTIYEYSPQGEYVRSIGGPGEGPGEFQIPVAMLTRGDSLYVQDNRNNRLSVFLQSTGQYARSQNLKFDELRPHQMLGVTDSVLVMLYSRPTPNLEVNGIVDHDVRLVPLTSSANPIAPVIWQTPGTDWKPIELNGMKMLRNMPLSRSSACRFAIDKGYCGYSTDVSINTFTLAGDSLSTILVESQSRPVTSDEREKILARFTAPQLREQMIVPDTHPAFAGKILVDSSERIWIRRGMNDFNQTEYWIVNPAANATKSVLINGTASINAISGTTAIARVTDDDGGQTVRLYSVPEEPG